MGVSYWYVLVDDPSKACLWRCETHFRVLATGDTMQVSSVLASCSM
jgi:hypothetical protein